MEAKISSTWTTDPLFIKQGADYYFYQNDQLGTPQKLTAINGAVVWTAKYSSFGKADIDGSSTITNNLRFPGQYYDQETGLHYNNFRYYDPQTGRYLRADPIGLIGGINLWTYVQNDPINLLDSLGLFDQEWFNRPSVVIETAYRNPKTWISDPLNNIKQVPDPLPKAWVQKNLGHAASLLTGVVRGSKAGAKFATKYKTPVGGAIVGGVSAAITSGALCVGCHAYQRYQDKQSKDDNCLER